MTDKKGMINITGASDGRTAPVIAEKLKQAKGQSLIVVPTLNKAKRLATDLSFFAEQDVFILQQQDESLVQYDVRNNEAVIDRMNIIKHLVSGDRCTVIAPVTAALAKMPPAGVFRENTIRISAGDDISLPDIREKLTYMGYERKSLIEGKGEYSIRGGIIDIFTPDSELPCRIELFDTEVDSIRTFDTISQRSVENLDEIVIYQCVQLVRDRELFGHAATSIKKVYDRNIRKLEKKETDENILQNLRQRRDQLAEQAENMTNVQYLETLLGYFYDETSYIWDYMDDPLIFIDDPSRILESLQLHEKERADDIDALVSSGRAVGDDFRYLSGQSDYFRLYEMEGYIFTPFVSTIKNAPFLKELVSVSCRATPAYNGRLNVLKSDLDGYVRRGYDVTIVCSSDERVKGMEDFLQREKLQGKVSIRKGTITGGMEFADRKVCYIWEGDIFGGYRGSRRKKKKSRGQQIKSFTDVQTGDYVVHETHGIGKFMGIEQLVVQGVKKDYLKVKYAGEDSLYIPVDQLSILEKYVGGDGIAPKLNRLSGNEWKVTKAKAKAAVDDMADELIRVSAARMSEKGHGSTILKTVSLMRRLTIS